MTILAILHLYIYKNKNLLKFINLLLIYNKNSLIISLLYFYIKSG